MLAFPDRLKRFFQAYGMDLFIGLVLSISGGYLFFRAALLIPELTLLDSRFDLWFQTDIPRIYSVLTDKESFHHLRTNTHPLYSLFGFSLRALIGAVLGINKLMAVRILTALIAGAWMAAFYGLSRVIGSRRLEAVFFTMMATFSASSLFGFVVPETFGLGAMGIIFALMLVIISQTRPLRTFWYFLLNVFTLSITTTNWSAGILATWFARPWRKAFEIFVYTFFVITLLWGVQKYFFPATNFFLDLSGESHFILAAESGGPLRVVTSFFYHTLIMPAIHWGQNPDPRVAEWPRIMLTQMSNPGSGSVWGMMASGIWSILLGLAAWNLIFAKGQGKARLFLGLMISGQLLLHSVYGEETFLYSLHFVVLLVPAVILAAQGILRKWILFLSVLMLPCLAINNFQQFVRALDYFNHFGTERERVTVQMTFRPHDPWPRGQGHVLLAFPGSREIDKAYHEPGGSFSPAVGSFGVSIWVVDNEGWLVTAGDTMNRSDISQSLVMIEGQPIPGVKTETPYYQAIWSSRGPGRWHLDLTPRFQMSAGYQLAVVARSVGPAGGPIRRLEVRDQQVLINDHWRITMAPNIREVVLGDEFFKGWRHMKTRGQVWDHDLGWGFAKMVLAEADGWSFEIDGPTPEIENGVRYTDVRPGVEISVPDQVFMDSLNAQVAHIMMAIVGRETRPADPIHIPISWHKDAAHIVAALASVGQLDVARQLSEFLAENDFSGGLGPEADAPGLAIWALKAVADRLQDPEYYQLIWPHVKRKTEIIEAMLSARQDLFRSLPTPLFPGRTSESYDWVNLLAKSAKMGLIIGRAESQFPILYVNAASFRGLVDASDLADRQGERDLANRWRGKAQQLGKAWRDSFFMLDQNPDKFIQSVAFVRWEVKKLKSNINNYLTYSNGLWPSAVAFPVADSYQKDLLRRWEPFRNDPAETHQWLYLGDLDRVWKKLRWFWWPNTQDSYGLYTWWEGQAEQNTFPGWEAVRGWVRPKAVSPQYGVAARMLMLQLDMLAYLDPQSSMDQVVIGQGVPREWLDHPMSVKGMRLPFRTLDWDWDGEGIRVRITGQKAEVRLGPAFPQGTKIEFVE